MTDPRYCPFSSMPCDSRCPVFIKEAGECAFVDIANQLHLMNKLSKPSSEGGFRRGDEVRH